jgi:hypothetical protein
LCLADQIVVRLNRSNLVVDNRIAVYKQLGESPHSMFWAAASDSEQNGLMTVVVACKLWKAVAVIADCRVSYLPPCEEVDDYLQKLYQIGNRLVMGFAGPLQGAYKVMELVQENARSYSKPATADNLQRDVERWVRHRYRELDEPDRKGLSFVLATVEPKREKQAKWFSSDSQGNVEPSSKPSWFPFVPEWKTIALRPSQSEPAELVREERRFAKVIGVQEEDREAIEETLSESYRFAFKQPALQMQAILGFLKAKLMERQVKGVGGLFQGALLSENGIQWVGYAGKDVVLEFAEQRFVQRNTRTGHTLPLMTIWEWAESRPAPGSFGVFEDVDLQRAIEGHLSTEDGPTNN